MSFRRDGVNLQVFLAFPTANILRIYPAVENPRITSQKNVCISFLFKYFTFLISLFNIQERKKIGKFCSRLRETSFCSTKT